jgi:RNA polymerase sigma factor (sigma-70 family)
MCATAIMVEAPSTQPAEDERTLLRALSDGDAHAAERLVRATYRRVYSYLCRLCDGDRELAEDLTQETYRRAWASLDSFQHRSRFSTWLMRIAYNAFLNHVRRPRLLTSLPDGAERRWSEQGELQDQQLDRRETMGRVRQAVMELPELLRTTVTARYWGEVPALEIARLEGVSVVAVYKRLRRALSILANTLEEPR